MGGIYSTFGKSQDELQRNWQALEPRDSKAGIRLTAARLPAEALPVGSWKVDLR